MESKVVPSIPDESASKKSGEWGRDERDKGQVCDGQFASDEVILFRKNGFENGENSLNLLGISFDTVGDLLKW